VPPAPARIKPLSTLVASQIAAGEVVERPASVVKELVENALDAGAGRIVIELEAGGTELVRVTDDGRGIDPDDLPLALAPHATSKIETAEDLNRIGTLGFRGEALASIASVSRLSLRSRTPARSEAFIIEAEGERTLAPRPEAGPIGTSVACRTLFFNTPARRKFLRTITTEQTRCLDVVRELAMAHPAVAFQCSCEARLVLDLPPANSPRERAVAILGPELETQLLEVHADRFDDARGLTLWGLAGMPSIARGSNKGQHVFLNGRAIRDRTIQHAIAESYRGLIEPSRYPTVVLMLEMSPEGVDVNVHPAKAEVRFRDSSMVHGTVLNAIKRALRAADLTPTFHPRPEGAPFGAGAAPRAIVTGGGGRGPNNPGLSAPIPVVNAQAFADFFKRAAPMRSVQGSISYDDLRRTIAEADAAPHDASLAPIPADALAPVPEPALVEQPRPAPRLLQVHNSFVVTQDEHGVVIVDQHALHERAMFEHLMARVLAGPLESQRLLTPGLVPCSPSQLARLDDLRPLFSRIGIEVEPMGPKSLGIYAFATFLFERNVDPVDFLSELLDRSEAEDFAPGSEQALREVLDIMACKAAVKAGDKLSEGELGELLELRDSVERSSNCPHGRPTSVRLTIKELERMFGRT